MCKMLDPTFPTMQLDGSFCLTSFTDLANAFEPWHTPSTASPCWRVGAERDVTWQFRGGVSHRFLGGDKWTELLDFKGKVSKNSIK